MMKNCRSHSLWALATLACAALSLPIGADEARVPLPDPDGRPADMSKPVQVYILMGQSNMLGFGKINGVKRSESKRKGPRSAAGIKSITAYLNRFAKHEKDSIYGRAAAIAAKKIADPDHVVDSASSYIRLAQTAE